MRMSFKASPWLKSLEGKHVMITGGSSGIGLAIAREALSQGSFVTLIARSSSNLEKAVESLAQEYTNAHDTNVADKICTKVADVGDYGALSKAINESFEWKPIDVLVCNAGFAKFALLEEAKIEDLHAIISTNLTGVVNTLHVGIPLMKQRSGQAPMSVVIMSGLSALHWVYGHSVYNATKHAFKGLAETLKLELMPFTIRISVVYPGFVETPMLDYCDIESNKKILQIVELTSLYDRSQAETPQEVAKYTLEAAKNGTFLVTSKFNGLALSTVSRGFTPAESFGRALVELILYIPIRLFSFIATWYWMSSIKKLQS